MRIKPADLRPGLTPAAQKLILQALSYNPKDRPESAGELGERLADALLPGSSARDSSVHATVPRKRRLMAGIAATILIASFGAGFWLWRFGRRPEAAKPKAAIEAPSALAVELEFWNSIQADTQPDLFRQYLSRYPNGQFAGIAKVKLDALTHSKDQPGEGAAQTSKDAGASSRAKELPSPRPSLNPEEYYGPVRGKLQWSGRLTAHNGLLIQAGRVQTGALNGDLPRVPVTIEVPPGISVVEPPSEQNNWDRLLLRNGTGKDLSSITISWRIAKQPL